MANNNNSEKQEVATIIVIDKAKVLTKTLEVESAASTTAVIEEYTAATNTVERATNLNKKLPLPVVPTGECNQ